MWKVLDAEKTARLLGYRDLAQEVGAVLSLRAAGRAWAPERQATPLAGGGVLLTMPASDGSCAVVKLITVHPDNPRQGLPAIQGEVVVLDAADGRRRCVLDGSAVTARRTAAVSLLAAMRLASRPEGPLLVIGAGVQGRAHAEAFIDGLGVREVYVASRTGQSAEALAAHVRLLGAEARIVADPAEAAPHVALVVTATSSVEPVLSSAAAERLPGDVFLAAVGSFRPGVAELPASVVRRCSLFVDTLEAAREEAGDLLMAGVDWDRVTPLERVLDGSAQSGGPVLFKSVGSALFDLAAARLALRCLGAHGKDQK